MTNYEKIKSMSVEEMAEMVSEMCKHMETCYTCPFEENCAESERKEDWEDWLNKEVSK